jgi:protein O-mannosyl-transferase
VVSPPAQDFIPALWIQMKRSFEKFCSPQVQIAPILYACVFLALLIFATYSGVAFNDFVEFDDEPYVYGNSHIVEGFSRANILWAWTGFEEGNWHPLTWMSHMLDVELFGLNPAGHHWMNVIFHACNAVLVFVFLHRVTGRYWESLSVAVLFAIHPLRVESVAWVSERKDVLSAFFYLSALCFYSRYVKTGKRSNYVATAMCMAIGLTAKAMPVTLPVLLLILDFWPFNRYAGGIGLWKIRTMFVEKIPLFVLSILASVIAFHAQSNKGTVSQFPLDERITQALSGYTDYILKFLFPMNLAVLYPYERGIFMQKATLAAVLLAVISIWVYRHRKDCPWAVAGWFWFLVTLAPVIGFVKIGMHSIADRYTYIPHIGLAILLCWGIAYASRDLPKLKAVLLPASGIVLICFVSLSIRQTGFWKSSESLYEKALKVAPVNFLMEDYLGVTNFRKGKHEIAVEHFKKSILINPYYAVGHLNMGGYYYTKGRLKEAEKEFLIALALEPTLAKARYYLDKVHQDPEWTEF